MDKVFHREFNKCPICVIREELAEILGKPELKLGNGEDRFLEQLANEAKKKGLAREDWRFHFQIVEGVVVDPTKAKSALIGSEAPGFGIMTDICMDCGCIYAADLTRIDQKKSLPPAQVIPPNRAERRRVDREQSPPFSLS